MKKTYRTSQQRPILRPTPKPKSESLQKHKSGGKTVSNSEFVNRWRDFWRDFNSKDIWRFPELPPDLQKSLDLHPARIDRSELIRAEWMWARKPRSILGESYPLLVFVALLLLLIPHFGILFTTTWCCAMLFGIARDVVHAVRWRREYEVSITRIMRGSRNLK